MAVLVLLIEGAVGRHDRDFSTAGPWDWRMAARRVERDAPGCDVLCFGDSQMKLGALPRVIETRTGRRVFNLALIGGQAPAATVLLRRSLNAGARPSAVLLNLMAPLLAAGIDRNDRQWPELLSVAECFELARTEKDAARLASLLLAKAFPTLKARPDIRAAVVGALQGESRSKRHEWPMHRRNWAFNRGAMLLPRYGDERNIPLWYAVNYPEPWSCDPTNAAYVRRFLRLAAAHKIRVYWLLAPIDPEAQALTRNGGQDARLEAFLKGALARYPNLTVIDARESGYDRPAFTDAVHLHAGGSFIMSNALADVLKAEGVPASPGAADPEETAPDLSKRWVNLPRFQDKPVDVPIEDINQSMLAIGEAGERRR